MGTGIKVRESYIVPWEILIANERKKQSKTCKKLCIYLANFYILLNLKIKTAK